MLEYTTSISYGVAAALFLGSVVLLLLSKTTNPYKKLLISAGLISFVWALCFTIAIWVPALDMIGAFVEPLRTGAWIGVVALLLHRLGAFESEKGFLVSTLMMLAGCALFVMSYWGFSLAGRGPSDNGFLQATLAAHLLMAVIGVLLTENLYRNADKETRWAFKHLCFGLATLFVYDFFMYSEAALFSRLDPNLSTARGLVNAIAMALIGVSATRSKDWPIDIHVSRRVVFHTVTLMAGGTYLLVMAVTGYAVGTIDATWSGPLQITFFAASILILVVVFSSESVRAWIRRFIAENFFSYKYDYREEWLQFIDRVSVEDRSTTIADRIVRSMADLVESTSAALWVYRSDDDAFISRSRWNIGQSLPSMAASAPLPKLFSMNPKLIDVSSSGVEVPEEIRNIDRAWLIVPLTHRDSLLAILVLGAPRATRSIDWEDEQLLLTAGSQAASYLAEEILSQDLLLARRFEDLNRRFAFVVHDIKNLTGQMSLMVANAEKYGDDPEFQEDMLRTVRDGLDRMRHLLVKLKEGPDTLVAGAAVVDLCDVASSLAEQWKRQPVNIDVDIPAKRLHIQGDKEGLVSSLNQLVQNAVEAIDSVGRVSVTLGQSGDQVFIEVSDDGPGMNQEYITQNLFEPMDSTKSDGYGLGAYQVRETVHAMGGQLHVKSEIGIGTTFTLLFPIVSGVAAPKVVSSYE